MLQIVFDENQRTIAQAFILKRSFVHMLHVPSSASLGQLLKRLQHPSGASDPPPPFVSPF